VGADASSTALSSIAAGACAPPAGRQLPHHHSRIACTACTACRYKEAFQVYIQELVLPSLRNHHDDHLLRQLKQRWDNQKVREVGCMGGWRQVLGEAWLAWMRLVCGAGWVCG
jgi:hypothetical protein